MFSLELSSQVSEYVRFHPASSGRAIQRGLALGWGETAYHLNQLVQDGTLDRVHGGRRDYYFAHELPAIDRPVVIALQNVIERKILLALARSEACTFMGLVERVGEGKSTVAFHLKYMVASGLVANLRTGTQRLYQVHNTEQIVRLYEDYRDSFEEGLGERFASTFGGLLRD
jgi:predicted transcriptional regulator